MRKRRHPLSGAIYDVRDDGLLEVDDHGTTGLFTPEGDWVSGELRHADPHLCGWLAGRQTQPGHGAGPKDLATTVRSSTTASTSGGEQS